MPQLVDQLKELTTLKENGALSEDEFQAAKAKLLSPEVQPATSFVELSFDPVGTWKCGRGTWKIESITLVITRAGPNTLNVWSKDARLGEDCECCGGCGGGGEHLLESSSIFTIKPMTGTFEGMLFTDPPGYPGVVRYNAQFKFINENEITTMFLLPNKSPWHRKNFPDERSLTFTRQSQDGSIAPVAMNRD